jgi:hypothetical protein
MVYDELLAEMKKRNQALVQLERKLLADLLEQTREKRLCNRCHDADLCAGGSCLL